MTLICNLSSTNEVVKQPQSARETESFTCKVINLQEAHFSHFVVVGE